MPALSGQIPVEFKMRAGLKWTRMSRAPQRRPPPTRTDLVDAALNCCANIAALAGLLEAGASAPQSAAPSGTVLLRAGYLIGEEAGKLCELVRRLDEALAKAASRR